MPATTRVADSLVAALRDFGVRYVFSVSGASIEPVHDAIHLHGNGRLRSILAKHESGAAFMADCHARAHGALGVCGSTSGGGMLNLLPGIAEANAESVPLLALVGQPPLELWGTGAFQDSSGLGRAPNAVQLFQSVCKYVAQLLRPQDLMPRLREAVRASLCERPGASVLLLPRDVLLAPAVDHGATGSIGPMPPARPPAPADVEALARMLRRAERPLFVLGHGSMRSPDRAEIVEFIRERRIPVLLTLSAKGAFPADDPLCYGMVGVSGNPSAVQLCQDADLVVLVGLGLNVMTRLPALEALRQTQTVYVNIDEGYIDRLLSPALKVIGDAGVVFKELRKSALRHTAWRPERVVTTLEPPPPAALRRPRESWGRREPALTMLEAVEVLKTLLPARSHLIVDAGNAGAVAAHVLPCPERGTFVTPLGMGGMGYAVAGAVGASLPSTGDDPTTTVVVAGDGALMMNGAEINTMVAYGLPIVIVVLNNGSHGMCLVRQQLFFESRFEAVEYPEVDAAALARALAGPEPISVATVDSSASLAETFQRFVSLRRPALIDVRVRTAEIPTFSPFLAGPLRSGNRQGHGTH